MTVICSAVQLCYVFVLCIFAVLFWCKDVVVCYVAFCLKIKKKCE